MAVISTSIHDVPDLQEPISVDDAYDRSRSAALADTTVGPVGLEIETHLVNLDSIGAPVTWPEVEEVTGILRGMGLRATITVEPGGQVELSCPPAPDIVTAVHGLEAETSEVHLALGRHGLGVAYVGADPLRPSQRVNPRPRYRAMEQHFRATGLGSAAAVMMNSTAALQVNLDAGPKHRWATRVAHAHRIGPTMVAISANSPWLAGRPTGWKSARQRAWGALDARACGPVPGCDAERASADDPADAWARFAMRAPVAFVRGSGDEVQAVGAPVPFEQWARGDVRLGNRAPTAADLDTHLTTLFPPVRMRGYLELRYLDVTAPWWWPTIAAVVTTLMDDPVAADQAAEATEQTALLWTEAARDGLGNAQLARSAARCLATAATRAPVEFASAIADLADLVESGRCPGDLLADRIKQIGPAAAFEELAHA
jgi:glutamate--cysteine ligase